MKITTYVDPTIADGYSKVEGLSPDDFTPSPDFMPQGSNSYYGANGDEFYNARGKWKKKFRKIKKGFGKGLKYVPPVALGMAIKRNVSFDGDGSYLSANGDEFYNTEGETYSYIDQKNPTEVKAFQEFVIKVKKDSAILGGFGADGKWGSNTQKAYDKYGADWEDYKKKALGVMGAFLGIPTSSSPVGVPTTAPQNDLFDVMINARKLSKSQKTPAVSGQPTPAQVEEQKKKGLFWDNAKKTWVSAKELGLVDYVLDIFGVAPKEPTPTPKKLSKTAKTILYIGGAVVIGLIIYAIAKPKKRA